MFAASAVLSWLSVETWFAPVPKVMAVWVPPPVAPMVSVSPLTGLTLVVPAERPSAASALPVPPSTRFWAVPVLTTSEPVATDEAVPPLAPVMLSIAARTSLTFSVLPLPMPIVTLPEPSVLDVVCAVEKVMVLPSTVRVEPLVIAVCRSLEAVPAVPTSSVVAVIAAAPVVASLVRAVPVTWVLAVAVPSRLVAVAPVMAAETTLDLVV